MDFRAISAPEARKQKAASLRLPLPSRSFLPVIYVTLITVLSLAGFLFISLYTRLFDKGSLEGSSDLIAFIVFITVILISWKGYRILTKGPEN